MRIIISTVVLFLMYLLMVERVYSEEIMAGLVVAFILSVLYPSIAGEKPLKWLDPKRYIYFIIYVPIFTWEMIKANLDVARRVLTPSLPINPGIVKVRTRLKSDIGKLFLANSITLTPGTLTVDVGKEYLYIHWIDVKDKDIEKATKDIVRKFEKYLEVIFD